jgi:hypothetical protein
VVAPLGEVEVRRDLWRTDRAPEVTRTPLPVVPAVIRQGSKQGHKH